MWRYPTKCRLTWMSLFTSCRSNLPFPSLSYILKDHFSLSSRFPRKSKCSAATYSKKSRVLSWRHRRREFYHRTWRAQNWAFYLVCVEGMENGLDVEGLFHRGALNTKDPLELVEVQSATWTLLHEKEAQFLNLRQVQLLGAAFILSHGPTDVFCLTEDLLTTLWALCYSQRHSSHCLNPINPSSLDLLPAVNSKSGSWCGPLFFNRFNRSSI